MKLTKLVYIASAYSYNITDPNQAQLKVQIEHQRMEAVTECIGILQDKYPYAFIGPITQSHQTAKYSKTKGGGFEYWMTIDFTYISRCDEMWILADHDGAWKRSVGVIAEIEFATANNIPIRFIHPDTFEVKKMLTKQKVKA